ncbi:MAG TPA: hypothetical protein VL461_00995 [Dictyobacter sp.]|nr:hypothetical protein [Dictyobacter sp.]
MPGFIDGIARFAETVSMVLGKAYHETGHILLVQARCAPALASATLCWGSY